MLCGRTKLEHDGVAHFPGPDQTSPVLEKVRRPQPGLQHVLDRILECYIEKRMPMKEIIACGFAKDTVADVLTKVNRNEYKRIQAAPGLKVTSKAFGIGRRVPIAQKFRP